MTRSEALALLAAHRAEIVARFGVRSLALFGSTARDEATPESDVDVLVDFGGAPDFGQYMEMKFFLEDLFQTRVDLVTVGGLKPRARPYVEKDVIHVA